MKAKQKKHFRDMEDLAIISDDVGSMYDEDDYFQETACRICGCTDSNPCDYGCEWVEPDLCSNPNCIWQAADQSIQKADSEHCAALEREQAAANQEENL